MLSRFIARRIDPSADPATSRDIPVDVSLPRRLLKAGSPPRASSIRASELSAVTLLTEQSLPASIYTSLPTPATIAPYYVLPVASTTFSADDISTTPSIPTDLPTTSTFSVQIVPVSSTPSFSSLSTVSQSSLSSSAALLSSPSATGTILLTSTASSPTAISTALSSSTNTSKSPNESATLSTTAIATPLHANQTAKWVGIGLGIAFFLLIVSVIVFFLLRRYKRNRAPKTEPEHGFIGGHELALKRQAGAQARTPYIPPRRRSKKIRANLESWKGGTVLDAKEEEAAEKALKENEEKEAKKAEEQNNEEPIRGPLKVVNADGVSLMEDEEDDADGRNTATVEQWGDSAQKARGNVTKPQDIGVALTR